MDLVTPLFSKDQSEELEIFSAILKSREISRRHQNWFCKPLSELTFTSMAC